MPSTELQPIDDILSRDGHAVTGPRRISSSKSARSLLITVLGEFVYPHSETVWTATLLEALGRLGVEEKAARQATSRAAHEGLLTSSRHGRRVQWRLSPAGAELLEAGTDRIFGFMRNNRPWDGRWLVLSIAIPETKRQLRHKLRTQLTWLGLGTPVSGLWVTPDADKEPAVRAVIESLGLQGQAFAWVGPTSSIGSSSRLLGESWDLGDVEMRYLQFIEHFDGRLVETPRDAFIAQVDLVHDWRRFPFLDPDLPTELLDVDWPGARAGATFRDKHARWHRLAQSEWKTMMLAGGSLL